jgi:MFS-type transporter involved in bile tolerance (Atg22 family)
MFLKQCNIDKTDRINRAVIGALIFLAALIGMSKVFFILLGVILIVEGLIGWCSIPYLIDKIRQHK